MVHNLVPVHPIWSFEALADSPFNDMYSHTMQWNMADRAWILEVWRKPVTVPFVALYQVSLCCYSGYLTFPL